MIQNISPLSFDNHYISDAEPDNDSMLMYFRGNKILCNTASERLFPTPAQMKNPSELKYLFSVGNVKYFLVSDYSSADEGFSMMNIRTLRHEKSMLRPSIFAMFTAFHLSEWYSASRYCGECGGKTIPCTGERALLCTDCGKLIYPRINPAVIVGVTNGDKLLVTRYVQSRGVNYDALVAGYMEIGETPEDTVRREVMEEVGLKIKNIRYYKSQPWGLSSGLLLGFFCDVDGDTEITLEKSELSNACWIKRENITGQPDDLSLTNEMMHIFAERKE